MAVAVADIAGADTPIAGGTAGLRMKVKTVTFDSSYPTGGEALTAADFGLSSIVWAHASNASGYVFSYDYTNSKLLAYRGDNDNAADAPMIEVANAVNLSAVATRVTVIGVP